jgi:ABC-type transport system substrate-binding protein
MWSNVGIETEPETLEQTAFIQRLITGRFTAALMANYGLTDPDFGVVFWGSATVHPIEELSINFSHIADPQIDDALERGRHSGDPDERKAAYADLVRRMNETVGHIWLYHQRWALIAQPRVGGLEHVAVEGFGRVDSKAWIADLWLDPDA